jgi:hypothetical protein
VGYSPEMDRTENRGRILAAILHDIDFAGSGPGSVNRIPRHEPESGPKTLTRGQTRVKLEPAVSRAEPPLGFKPSGGISRSTEVFLSGNDVQQTVAEDDVLRTGGVVFQFVVAPTGKGRACANVISPATRIHGDVVKLVIPNQPPICQAARWEKTNKRPKSQERARLRKATDSLGTCGIRMLVTIILPQASWKGRRWQLDMIFRRLRWLAETSLCDRRIIPCVYLPSRGFASRRTNRIRLCL